MELEQIIRNLIETQKEGNYWDFKQQYPENNAALIKDIICLANSVRHTGDRYLIFGVSDRFEVKGIEQDKGCKKQSDIIDTLRNAGFEGGNYPDIELKEVTIENQKLDVLIIKDVPQKPYYLEKDYSKTNGATHKINAGTIYARVQDTNTPMDKVASSKDIEKMWRQRFGLDSPPFERVQKYLLDFKNWEEIDGYYFYYKQFPEFTVSYEPDSDGLYRENSDHWVRAEPDPKGYHLTVVVKFYQTELAKVRCAFYDGFSEKTPNPKSHILTYEGYRRFYYLCGDTFEFIVLQFIKKQNKQELLQNGLSCRALPVKMPVLIFASTQEKNAFVKHIEDVPPPILPEHKWKPRMRDTCVSDNSIVIITYTQALMDYYDKWKLSLTEINS